MGKWCFALTFSMGFLDFKVTSRRISEPWSRGVALQFTYVSNEKNRKVGWVI